MRKHAYIENSSDAHCSECKFRCDPICDDGAFSHEFGTSSFGEEWTSHCCSVEIVEDDGREWTPDICEGNPEP
jgi:hypothetical protein